MLVNPVISSVSDKVLFSITKTYKQTSKQIFALEPIDYFFAKDLLLVFGESNSGNDQEKNLTVLFHLLISLSESLRSGHSCLPIKQIANHHYGYACDEEGIISHHGFVFPNSEQLTALLNESGITADDNQAIVYANNALYLRRYFNFEQQLQQFIISKNSDSTSLANNYSVDNIKICLEQLFPTAEHESEIDWQKIAVANAINKNFSVIAGGPGTGKTYTVTKLLAALLMLQRQQGLVKPKIALVAPTGKAAQRLSESIEQAITGFKGVIAEDILDDIPCLAQTLHRLLGVIPNSPNFRHHQDNLLDVGVILVDEVSMVDLPLMTRLFRALPAHCKVILLGDADQLPSVAAGSVLTDVAPRPHPGYSPNNAKYLKEISGCKQLISSKKQTADHLTFLMKSRRFDGDGGIGLIAKAVIAGQVEHSWKILNDKRYSEQLQYLNDDITTWLTPLVQQYYQPLFSCNDLASAFNCLLRFRILAATRVGNQGVESLNELVKNILIRKGCIPTNANIYHGQPIMIKENNYQLGLYNGDIGIVWKNEQGHLIVAFQEADGNYKMLMPSRLPQYETVFAMTIHKTQGSEFDHVIMILPNQAENRLLSRELIYTGVTRAKSKLSIACLPSVWRHGVDVKIQRFSNLAI